MSKLSFNATQLKIIAVIFMIIDHLHTYLNFLPDWIVFFTRFVAPLFVFLLVEGFIYTSNRMNYLIRLLSASIIMLIGNMIINIIFHQVDVMTGQHDVFSLIQGNNIFMTLTLAFVIIWLLELMGNKQKLDKLPYIIIFIILVSLSILVEGGPYLIPLAIIFYIYRQQRSKLMIWTALFCLLVLISDLLGLKSAMSLMSPYKYFTFNSQFFMILVIPFIYWYNGQLGKMKVIGHKYFFYTIYPLHLWVLKILRIVLN